MSYSGWVRTEYNGELRLTERKDIADRTLSVIGLGKLGLPLACVLADAGYYVIGVDKNKQLVEEINIGVNISIESGLDDLLDSVQGSLTAMQDIEYAVHNSKVIFIVVPTPSMDNGRFSVKYVDEVACEIGKAIKNNNGYRTIALVSTVLPGDTDGALIDTISTVSDKECGIDFGVCYSPTMIALGSVIYNLQNPDMVFIGESDKKAGDIVEDVYKTYCKNNPPIYRNNIRSIELVKISLNVFITMKMSYAMMLSEICERIPGCNVDEIVDIIGADSRVGKKYLKAGLSYGGPCFPRDNRAFSAVAASLDVECSLSEAADDTSMDHARSVIHKIYRILVDTKLSHAMNRLIGKRIAILGLTYKTDTDVVEESAALKLAEDLFQMGCHISVYNPTGTFLASKTLGNDIYYASDIKSCILHTELAIIAVPWKEFADLSPDIFLDNMKTSRVLDCWRMYNPEIFQKAGVEYYCIGRHGY